MKKQTKEYNFLQLLVILLLPHCRDSCCIRISHRANISLSLPFEDKLQDCCLHENRINLDRLVPVFFILVNYEIVAKAVNNFWCYISIYSSDWSNRLSNFKNIVEMQFKCGHQMSNFAKLCQVVHCIKNCMEQIKPPQMHKWFEVLSVLELHQNLQMAHLQRGYNASVNSKHQHPPGLTPGEFI